MPTEMEKDEMIVELVQALKSLSLGYQGHCWCHKCTAKFNDNLCVNARDTLAQVEEATQ